MSSLSRLSYQARNIRITERVVPFARHRGRNPNQNGSMVYSLHSSPCIPDPFLNPHQPFVVLFPSQECLWKCRQQAEQCRGVLPLAALTYLYSQHQSLTCRISRWRAWWLRWWHWSTQQGHMLAEVQSWDSRALSRYKWACLPYRSLATLSCILPQRGLEGAGECV